MGFELGTSDSTVRLNAIWSVLISHAVYCYGWAVLFRGSIIRPGYAEEKVNSKLCVRVFSCVCRCVSVCVIIKSHKGGG